MDNLSDNNERSKKLCKYCAEEIYEEAVLCRFCGKKQQTVIDKVGEDLEENRGNVGMNKSYWIFIWLPPMLLIGLGYFIGFISGSIIAAFIPIILAVIYMRYMDKKYG